MNRNDNHRGWCKELSESHSEVTIYRNAIQKRQSSSSEGMDIIDKFIKLPFVTDQFSDDESPLTVHTARWSIIPLPVNPQPSTSGYNDE